MAMVSGCTNNMESRLMLVHLFAYPPYSQTVCVFNNNDCNGDYNTKKKAKDSRNRPGVAQKVPGALGSQISMTSGK